MFFLRYMRQLNARDGAARRFSVLDFDTRHRVILRLLQRCKFVACFRNFSRQFVYRFTLFFPSLSSKEIFSNYFEASILFFLEILSISLETIYQETFINETIIECFFFSKLIFGRFSLFRKFLIISNERQTIQNYVRFKFNQQKIEQVIQLQVIYGYIGYFNVLFYYYIIKIKYNIQGNSI